MRNPGRIKIICERLASEWQRLPDWRLGQLMSNIFVEKDCFYMEDNEFIEYVNNFINKVKNEK